MLNATYLDAAPVYGSYTGITIGDVFSWALLGLVCTVTAAALVTLMIVIVRRRKKN